MTSDKAKEFAEKVLTEQVKECSDEMRAKLLHIVTVAFLEGYTQGLMYYLNGIDNQSVH